jgi:hypothetical protein
VIITRHTNHGQSIRACLPDTLMEIPAWKVDTETGELWRMFDEPVGASRRNPFAYKLDFDLVWVGGDADGHAHNEVIARFRRTSENLFKRELLGTWHTSKDDEP